MQAANWLGLGISHAVNLIAPDVIVLGGGLIEALPHFYFDEILKSTARHIMPSFRGTYRAFPAVLGDFAVATGSAAWVRDRIDAYQNK